jgi:hypothetical protein
MTIQHAFLRRLGAVALIAAGAAGAGAAQAGEVYGNLGFPGVGLGYAHPLNSSVTLRGDFMTLGSQHKNKTQDGIDYAADLKANRGALFADWFPFEGVFRFTAGVGSANYKLTLDAAGAGKRIEVGDNSYVLGPTDGMTVVVKYPRTMPYLGVGWGHQQASGFRFSVDVGTLIGKPTVDATARGTLASNAAFQSDLDKEVNQVRDDLGKVRYLPQLTFSVGYSF